MNEELDKKILLLKTENQSLKAEILRLQELLEAAGVKYAVSLQSPETEQQVQSQEFIINENISVEQIDLFITLFHGRTDVYAKRFISKAGNVGYSPGCNHFWRQGLCPKKEGQKVKCFDCPNRNWIKLNRRLLRDHLEGHKADGTDVIGVYPMLADETCYFIVFDFDNHDKKKETNEDEGANIDNEWINDFQTFLKIDEPLPTYETKKGERTRKSLVGRLYAGHDSLGGIIDVAMITSFGKQDSIDERIKDYGLIIVDECHHAGAQTHEAVIREIQAEHVYGLTATPKREDGKEQKVYMQFGPIRYRLTAKDRAKIFPRLDTMMLAAPISWQGNVEQYAGRLHRDYEGKKDVIIYDYVDAHIKVLERMYHKRLRTYKKIGYEICLNLSQERQQSNAIFDMESYQTIYEKDLQQANKEIVISSPGINKTMVMKTLEMVKIRQMAGVMVNVITIPAEDYPENRIEVTKQLTEELIKSGVSVKLVSGMHEHFAVIDQEIVWYGSLNLLSKGKEEDNLMRVRSADIAAELLEMEFAGREKS